MNVCVSEEYGTYLCKCPNKEFHESTLLQRRKASRGKRTSEGYTPNPDEIVEVRGD